MNGTLIESRCENVKCSNSILENIYEINQCGEMINENTKYSQTAMISDECIVRGRYSVKHKYMKGNTKKVKSIYYSDDKCTKKIKSYVSHCDVNEVDYNKDTCKESGSEDQVGVISDHCCIRSNV